MGRLSVIILLVLLSASCRMGQSQYMSEEQRQRIEASYDSLQQDYEQMKKQYRSGADTLPADFSNLFIRMQQAHQQMQANHRQMMSQSMGGHMEGGEMMSESMGMQMQGHMTGEWFQQMMGMHQQMASMFMRRGNRKMANMNQKLARGYQKLMNMVPGKDEPIELRSDNEKEASRLNGKSLFGQNCSSCHGNDASGMAGVFPPLINSKWVTADKDVPIRILLHGLSGEIEVDGQTYQGVMPSFRARLSAAEIAAILNYLRSESKGEQPEISTKDVTRLARRYSERTSPWKAQELEAE